MTELYSKGTAESTTAFNINELSDPADFNPQDFCFIVHGGFDHLETDAWINRVKKLKDETAAYRAAAIGVNEEHNFYRLKPFGSIGLILKPKEEDLLIASDRDIGSPNNQDNLKTFIENNRGKILPTEKILFPSVGHKEFILSGNSEAEIQGIVHTRNAHNRAEVLQKLVEAELNITIPLVEIPPIDYDKIECLPIEYQIDFSYQGIDYSKEN
jgi:hypothetical protein